MKRTTTITAVAFASVLALAGCGNGNEENASGAASQGTAGSEATSTESTSPSGDSAALEVSEEHNEADVAFAEGMIPHHQQAVEMSQMLLEKEGVDPQVRDLAERVVAAQGPEIERMNAMLEAWGQQPVMSESGGMDHGSMGGGSNSEDGMGAMMSEEDMAELEAAEGVEAAELYLTQMIEHHRGAIEMAREEVNNGSHPRALELAQDVVEDQEAEIQEIEGLLERTNQS